MKANIGKCVTCGSSWCDKHNQCVTNCHGNCKTFKQDQGEYDEPYPEGGD